MSGWELAYFVYMKDQGHCVERYTGRFEYYYEGKRHFYYPDFIVDNTQIVEIKGLETQADLEKYKVVPELVIVKEAEIETMLKYAQDKFQTRDLQSVLHKKIE